MTIKDNYLIIAATLLAALLSLWALDKPLYGDEFYTYVYAQYPLDELWFQAALDSQAPLYYFLMHFWTLLGTSEFWLRLPSAIAFVLTVPVAASIGKIIADDSRAGVYVAFLTATTPFMIHYAQTARGYAMMALFCALALFAVVRIIKKYRDSKIVPPPSELAFIAVLNR